MKLNLKMSILNLELWCKLVSNNRNIPLHPVCTGPRGHSWGRFPPCTSCRRTSCKSRCTWCGPPRRCTTFWWGPRLFCQNARKNNVIGGHREVNIRLARCVFKYCSWSKSFSQKGLMTSGENLLLFNLWVNIK
jgi:hypothetical protein